MRTFCKFIAMKFLRARLFIRLECSCGQQAGLTVDDDKAVRAQKLEILLDNFGLKSSENQDIISSLLGMSLTSTIEASAPTPFLFKRKQFALLGSLFEQMARKQPTLLWVEDVHWIDPSSGELLQEIVKRLENTPVLVLLTGRSFPKSPALPDADDVIELTQLDVEECFELARAIPGAQGLSDDELVRAVEAADGIPLICSISCSIFGGSKKAGIECRSQAQ